MPPHAKVSNLFPAAPVAPNRPHSARFSTARQFTKKAPRPNVNASYRNKQNNAMPTEESLTQGVLAANRAIQSRLQRMYPTRMKMFGGRRKQTRRGRKGTRKYRR